jgi:hypothetical protein
MATKKDIKEVLKKLGKTEEEMQAYWDEAIEYNPTVKALSKAGKNWKDLHIRVIEDLPNMKEKTLKRLAEVEAREREEAEKKKKKLEEEAYYREHFEEIMVKKIDNGELLDESELAALVFECNTISTTYGDKGRWSRSAQTIVELEDRYFCVDWYEGLTENQDNEFYDQPYEVEKHTYEKTITVTEWRKIKK